jgi:hypothetical protein
MEVKMEDKVIPEEKEIIETQPNAQSITEKPAEIEEIPDKYLSHLELISKNIDRFIRAKEKIWQAVLKLAKPGDWVVFESEDRNAPDRKRSTVCLTGAGADRIAVALGISFTNWSEKKEEGEDEKGRWYRYWFETDASLGTRTIRAIGRASSRDKFFGYAHGELKEISEIDESNVRMAAYHNAMKEGVKLLLGLRNIPIEEFQKANITLVYARKVELKKEDMSIKYKKEDMPDMPIKPKEQKNSLFK